MYALLTFSDEIDELMPCSPIYSRPFVYDIPDDAYSNGLGRYTVGRNPSEVVPRPY